MRKVMTPNKISIKKHLSDVTLLAISFFPLFNSFEIYALISGTLVSQVLNETPIQIKVIKDIFMIYIVSISFFLILRENRIKSRLLFFWIINLFLTILVALLFLDDVAIYVAGVRWLVPLILPFFIISYVDEMLIRKISGLTEKLFIINLLVQVYQLFFASQWFGAGIFGLSLRNPGLFLIPSTSAFFVMIVFFFKIFYSSSQKFLNRYIFIFFLIPLSLFLTASATGLVAYFFSLIIVSSKRIKAKLLVVFSIIVLPVIYMIMVQALPLLTSRAEVVEVSLMTRIDILLENISDIPLLSSKLGYATNTGVLLANVFNHTDRALIADSTVTSIIYNMGLVSSMIMLVVFLTFILYIVINNKKEELTFLTIVSIFSLTVIITEAFPMNLIISCYVAFFIDRNFRNSLKSQP